MLKYYVILFFRNIKTDKNSFLINIIGLSTGLACAVMIYLWIFDEINMDKFHERDSQIFQVLQHYPTPNGIMTSEATPGPLAQALKDEIPEIELATSVIPTSWFDNEGIISLDGTYLKAGGQFVTKDYFKIFSYPLVEGNPNKIFKDKNSILISEDLALQLFSTTDNIVGETVEWNNKKFNRSLGGLFTISGVFKSLPSNSTEQFDLVLNFDYFFEIFKNNLSNWGNSNPNTYILSKLNCNSSALNDKITNFISTKDHHLESNTLSLVPYSERYLYNNYESGVQVGGRIEYVKLFSVIAIIILTIACINFMNLSTARATRRIKEIAVKKVIGANRKKLVFQYLTESLLYSFLALLVAIILVVIWLPNFNQITGKNLSFAFNAHLVLFLIGITIFTGLFSGSYPAFYLSNFKPAKMLKGKLNNSFEKLWTRKGLVVFQLSVSTMLIFAVIVLYNQMAFIQNKNLGYNRDNIIHINKEGKTDKELDAFLYEIKKIPGVINATNSFNVLVNNNSNTTGLLWDGKSPDENISFAIFDVNYDFIETFNIELEEGRSFSREYSNENSKIIFNEAAIKSMGLSHPLGKSIKLWNKYNLTIVGIVKNFQFKSLYESEEPCLIKLMPPENNYGNNIWIKIKAGEESATIKRISNFYNEFNPGYPFEFKFVDDEYQALYNSENKVAILSKYFAGIAIILSCLGLFGLAVFTVQRRFKEIGVRKIQGSTGFGIIKLILGHFSKLFFISIVIALPIGYLIMQRWLNEYAYKIQLEWWIFAISGFIVLFVALISVGTQAIKAANFNPVVCLKDD